MGGSRGEQMMTILYRHTQMIFAKAAAPTLPSSFCRRIGFSATTAGMAATTSRPLPKIALILLTQTETSSLRSVIILG